MAKDKKLIDNEYYAKNKELILAKRRAYRQNNKDKLQEYWASYRSKNKDLIAQKNKQQYRKKVKL